MRYSRTRFVAFTTMTCIIGQVIAGIDTFNLTLGQATATVRITVAIAANGTAFTFGSARRTIVIGSHQVGFATVLYIIVTIAPAIINAGFTSGTMGRRKVNTTFARANGIASWTGTFSIDAELGIFSAFHTANATVFFI